MSLEAAIRAGAAMKVPPPIQAPRVMVADIVRICCGYYRVSEQDFFAHRRAGAAKCRRVAYYLSHILTSLTPKQIGVRMERDFQTIICAYRAVSKQAEEDVTTFNDLEYLKSRILLNARVAHSIG